MVNSNTGGRIELSLHDDGTFRFVLSRNGEADFSGRWHYALGQRNATIMVLDVDKIIEAALQLGKLDTIEWEIEGEPEIQLHPVQNASDTTIQ